MMGRKSGTGVRSAALVAIGALAGFGCDGTPEDDFYGPLVYEVLPAEVSGPFTLEHAYAGGESWQYVDVDPGLVSFNTIPGKVYIMKGVDGQHPIIDALPGTLEYSPFWQIVEVTPPSDYKANQIKSLQTIEDAELDMKVTDEFMHCPVVNPDAAWIDPMYSAPLEFFGLPGLPVQVIWNAGLDMPDVFREYWAPLSPALAEAFGVDEFTPAMLFDFLAGPQYEPAVDPETGEPIVDPDTMEPVLVLAYPGYRYPQAFVDLFTARATDEEDHFITDAEASPFDVQLQPVWHKRLRGFCLPETTPGQYSATADEFGDLQIGSGTIYSVDTQAAPVFGGAPGEAGYSPYVNIRPATAAELVTDAGDLAQDAIGDPITDESEAEVHLHVPIVRPMEPLTAVEEGN